MPGDSDVERTIDGLYTLDLSEFTAARDASARELRTAGDRDAAKLVKALAKPSRAAWAINQVVRASPLALDAVVEAGSTLRDVQQEALASGPNPSLHEATRARRAAVRAFAELAVAHLGPTGASARDAIEQTLNAASIDAVSAAAVRAARLTRELDPPDIFETLEAVPRRPAPPTKDAPAPAVDPAARRRADKATALAQKARTAAEDARRVADEARRGAEVAEARAVDAEGRAEQAEREADEALAALESP
jgi:hypothetical protein